MAPVKFDDIPKAATEVLNDDYQTVGYVFKAKQKASYGGAVLSTQVDFAPTEAVGTPAKLAWKLPAPLGVSAVTIDKLEMDKAKNFKLEASSDKVYKGLKVEVKSDLKDLAKVNTGLTYTGVKDAQFKLDFKTIKPQDSFIAEATYAVSGATLGVKATQAVLSGGFPDAGLRFLKGPVFFAALAKENLKTYNVFAAYTASPDIKVAATYQHGGKANGAFTVGVVCKGLYRAKVSQDKSVSVSVKTSLAKGFTFIYGLKYGFAKGDYTYGVQLSIE